MVLTEASPEACPDTWKSEKIDYTCSASSFMALQENIDIGIE